MYYILAIFISIVCIAFYTYAEFVAPNDAELKVFVERIVRKIPTEIPLNTLQNSQFGIKEIPCDTCPNKLRRFIVDNTGKVIIQLPSKFQSLLSHVIYKNKIVFSGHSQNGIISVIVDASNFVIQDVLLHFSLSEDNPVMQSPSGRFLLLKKFSPRAAPASIYSNFIMIYDLEKSAKENRIYGQFNNDLNVTSDNAEIGHFFYPENKELEYSENSPYFTYVNDPAKQIFLHATNWDIKNKLTIVSEKTKLNIHKFIIITETPSGLTKRIVPMESTEVFDINNTKIQYSSGSPFFMSRFEIVDNMLKIYNSMDNSNISYVCIKLLRNEN
ncbi:MAG: hypothetical protein E7036_02160 [Opitutales bacterium]|nr:hypothetical protein [Opitutales bacterium]